MIYLGDFPASHTAVPIPFDTFSATTGAPTATTNFANTDVQIYKDGGTTQRSSANGITASTTFDSNTGLQLILIDLSDNTDSGFYAAGHEYTVAVADITADGQTLRFWAGAFSIERAGGVLALIKANNIKVDLNTIKTQSVTCGAGVTVLASVGTAATSTAQTGDSYARLGAPVNASISADIAEVEAETDDIAAIKTQTDKLAFTVTNQIDANVLDWKSATAPAMTGDAYARIGAAGVGLTAVSIATGGIISGAHAAAELNAIADALLDRNMTIGTDNGTDSTAVRTVRQALRRLRNREAIATGTGTIYKEDDSTASWTYAATTAAGDPLSEVNPT